MTTFYVSPTGSDSKDGKSTGTAFKSLKKAFAVVKPGDTILLMDGVHDASTPQTVTKSGTASAPITVKGKGTGAIVDGKNSLRKVIYVEGSYWRFSGFAIRNGSYGIHIEGSNNVLDRLKVSHTRAEAGHTAPGIHITGIHITPMGTCDLNVISNCEVFDTGGEGIYLGHAWQSDGLEVNCSQNEIFGNYIHDFASEGIEVKPYSEKNNVHDNRIEHGDTGLRIDETTIYANNTFLDVAHEVVTNKRKP